MYEFLPIEIPSFLSKNGFEVSWHWAGSELLFLKNPPLAEQAKVQEEADAEKAKESEETEDIARAKWQRNQEILEKSIGSN